MPKSSKSFHFENTTTVKLIDATIKASIAAGLQASQIADNIVSASRGMSGMSWPIDINLYVIESDSSALTLQIEGTIGGYGPIQKSELNKCIDAISGNLFLSLKSARSVDQPNPTAESFNSSVSDDDEISGYMESISNSLSTDLGSPLALGRPDSSAVQAQPSTKKRKVDSNPYPNILMNSNSIDTNIAYLMRDLSSSEKIMFMNEYNSNKKTVTNGVLLALFLGGLGVHKFWLGNIGMGILYVLFCWTFIPSFVALIDACLMGNTIKNYNLKVANNAYQSMMIMR